MTKDIDIDKLIDEVKANLAYYLDANVYVPVKEELTGVEHSLGIRKELFKSYVESELEKLKVAINEQMMASSDERKFFYEKDIKKDIKKE